MSWPYACAVCGSRFVQATADEIFCLDCGRLTDKHGVAVPQVDQFTSEELSDEEIGKAKGLPLHGRDSFMTQGKLHL
jgi:hypothetical protein